MTLAIDRGATAAPLKLYHFGLAQTYSYPGFYVASPPVVGIAAAGVVQAFRYVSGAPWTGYFSSFYTSAFGLIQTGSDFNNAISTSTDPKTYGIMWDLGTAASTHTVSYDMIFSSALPPPPDQMAAPIATAGNGSATVTVMSPNDNGSAITGYAVTSAPENATCAMGPLATSCVVPGLTNGTAYTFVATATNANGASAPSPASNSVTPTAPPADPDVVGTGVAFADIPAGETALAASWLALQGIVFGCEGGAEPRFCPDDLATRAEVATFLTRALVLPGTAMDAFTDDNGHSLEDNLNRTAAARVFLGCGDGLVGPNAPITRGELAAVLVRALTLVATSPRSFADSNDHWARSFVETVGGLGISHGCAPDEAAFCPDDLGTRG